MKILTVVGARPNFMKAAPILAAINAHNERLVAGYGGQPEPQVETIRHILVHTGQHYDELMSGSFFNDLNLPKPDIHLGVGSGSHATQTAEIMKKFEEVLLGEKPDIVIVVGDVNSTLACALVTSKISFDSDGSRPVIAHVEAGLRSFDPSMPEEVNRILTDHVSDLLFVTEESGLQNLRHEGVLADKIHFVGNTMIDSLLYFKEKAEASTILEKLGLLRQGRKKRRGQLFHPICAADVTSSVQCGQSGCLSKHHGGVGGTHNELPRRIPRASSNPAAYHGIRIRIQPREEPRER